MSYESYFAFCVAAMALAFVPGPTVTVIIANSLRYGSRAGLMNVAGTQAGVVIWLAIAALGLGAAIQLMGVWFDVLRWAGAIYLVWLGIKLFRSNGDLAIAVDRARPKGKLLPAGLRGDHVQSQDAGAVRGAHSAVPFQGWQHDAADAVAGRDLRGDRRSGRHCYALLAGKAGTWLSRSRIRAIEIVSGICLTAGGVWMALRGR